MSVLQIIAFAYRPLKVLELYFALRSVYPDFDISQVWDPYGVDRRTAELFILNCSKGLAELTTVGEKPNYWPPTVQFIHESVRDYWQETGFDAITLRRGSSVVGSAHENLKRCCLRWISSDVLEKPRAANLGNKPYHTWASVYGRVRIRDENFEDAFTFLSYAVANVVRHAEVACTHGFPQDNFVQSFPLEEWIALARLVGDWLSDDATPVSLTEVLVSKGAKSLLAIELRRGTVLSCQIESALQLALSKSDLTCFRMLLEAYAPSEISVEQKINTLKLAVWGRNTAALELMFSHGTHTIPLQQLATPLRRAAEDGLSHVVKVLLDHTELPMHGNAELESAIAAIFLSACMRGDQVIVHVCLQKGANPNSFIHGNKASVRACLEENAYPRYRVHGRPLFRAVSAEGHSQILEMLFEHGADPDVEQGKYYHDAFCEALRDGRNDIVRILASHGVEVTQQPSWFYWSVIEDLTLRRRGDALCMLLDGVRGFCAQDREVYVEALRLATSRGFDEIVEILRDRGVKLPEEALPTVGCASHNAWVNALPGDFLIRESMDGLSISNESAEDEMI